MTRRGAHSILSNFTEQTQTVEVGDRSMAVSTRDVVVLG